jgi:serine/threonine protein kinase
MIIPVIPGYAIQYIKKDKWDPKISKDCADFIRGLRTVDPAERLSAGEALSHPWMADDENKRGDDASHEGGPREAEKGGRRGKEDGEEVIRTAALNLNARIQLTRPSPTT